VIVKPQRILVVGAGHVGLYAALRLSKKLRSTEAEVTIVDPQPHMTYQPFLPEAAAGSINPRHSVVPLRRELRRCKVLSGEVVLVEHARKVATVAPIVGPPVEVPYDIIVVVPGSVSRTLADPGPARERGRFQDDRRGDLAAQPRAGPARRRGHHLRPGHPGQGADLRLRRRRVRRHRGAGRDGGHDPATRCATTTSSTRPRCAGCWSRRPPGCCPRWTVTWGPTRSSSCASANIDVRLETRLESCVDGMVRLSDGDSFAADNHRLDGRGQAVADAGPHRPSA